MTIKQREAGRKVLRAVLGDDYLKQRDRTTTEFNRPLRELSESLAFGDVWSRPGLERKYRSMLCLCMLTALNRPDELRLHVVSAINNGCTVEEIQEVLYQSAVYCGLPAAMQATRVAEAALQDMGCIVKPRAKRARGR
jgi:4-carboxymuconolactone decarboxylase